MSAPWKIGLIGPGRLGKAFAGELARRGLGLTALAGRRMESVSALARRFGACPATPAELVALTDLVIFAIPDDALPGLAVELGKLNGWAAKIALHTSGALDSGVLAPLRAAGAAVGSMHPLQSFAGEERIPAGTFYGIEGDDAAVEAARTLVRQFEGVPLPLTPERKALYHAAACMAANYLLTLLDLSVKMLTEAGLERRQALPALLPLVDGVVANIHSKGIASSLTGPVVRGDSQTIARHVSALNEYLPQILPLYKALAEKTLDLAAEAGLPRDKQTAVQSVLEGTKRGRILE